MNPWKAMDKRLAVMSAIGNPFIASEIGALSIFSLIPAKMIITRANPIPAPTPLTIDSMKLYPSWTFIKATQRTAQFVVIRGR